MMKRWACATGIVLSMASVGLGQTTAPASQPALSNAEAMQQLQKIDKLFQSGQDKEALTQLNALIEKNPLPLALWARAQMLTRAKDFDGALKDIDTLIASEPRNPQFLIAKAQIYTAKEDHAEAVKTFEKVKPMLSAAPPQFRVQLLGALAESKMKNKDMDGARKEIDDAIKLTPADPRLYRFRATINTEDQKYSVAIKDLDQAITAARALAKTNPGAVAEVAKFEKEASETRSGLRVKAKDFGGALRDMELALRAKPADEKLEDAMLEIIKEMKFSSSKMPFEPLSKAEADLTYRDNKNYYDELEKKLSGAHLKIGFAIGAESYAEAEKEATAALEKSPHAGTYEVRGEAKFLQGKFKEAARDYRLAAALYAAQWSANSVMFYRGSYEAEECASWADYAARKSENKLNDLDKQYEAALAAEKSGDTFSAYRTLQKMQRDAYSHKPAAAAFARLDKQREKFFEQFLVAGNKALASGNIEEARTDATGAVGIYRANDNRAYLLLAKVEQKAGDEAKFLQNVQAALAMKFDDGPANLLLGDHLANGGKTEEAMLAYNAGAYGRLAKDLAGDAKTCAEKRDALEAKLGQKATKDFYVSKANAALKETDQRIVVLMISRIIGLGMDSAVNYGIRARALHRIDRSEESIKDAETAMKLDPKLVDMNLTIGDAQFKLKKYELAADSYTKGMPAARKPYMVHYLRGLSYLRTKQFDKAMEDAEAAIKIDDQAYQGYHLRASVHYWKKNIQQAADDFKIVAEKAPESAIMKSMANLYELQLLQHRINGTEAKFNPKWEEGGPGLND